MGEYSHGWLTPLLIALLAGCEESLPPRNEPQNFLDVTFQGEDGTVELRDGETLVSTTPGGFTVSVKNLYEEVLQDEEDINIDIDFWLAGNESISGTAHGDRSALLFSHMIQNGNLLTIEPQETALFHVQWDHAAEQFWKYTDLTFEVEHGSPFDIYFFESGPITLAAKGTARLFKTTGVLQLVEDQFTINYKIYVDPPVVVHVDSLIARYDASIDAVILEWETPVEINNYGFRVENGMDQSAFESASPGLIPGQGSTSSETFYSFTDSLGLSPGLWYYRLEKWYDWGFIQGPVGYSDTVSVQIP